ncbi:hypothetical protein, partial [Salmonella enterica]|uniref:hypothetical protein n=1 Tax=Salmonella enterica TaxID=28901 RepID=UPI001BAEBB36
MLSLVVPVPHTGKNGGESFGITFNNRLKPGLQADVQLPDSEQAAAKIIGHQQFNSSTVQQFNSSTVQQFNSSTVQQ